jgi:hypothetical protein
MTTLTEQIKISKKTKEWLNKKGKKGETYDEIINKQIIRK